MLSLFQRGSRFINRSARETNADSSNLKIHSRLLR